MLDALQCCRLAFACERKLLQVCLQLGQPLFAGLVLIQLKINFSDAPIQQRKVVIESLAFVSRPRLVDFPDLQAQDTSQHILPLACRLLRELVGFALEEESRVDEGLVIETQSLFNAELSLCA